MYLFLLKLFSLPYTSNTKMTTLPALCIAGKLACPRLLQTMEKSSAIQRPFTLLNELKSTPCLDPRVSTHLLQWSRCVDLITKHHMPASKHTFFWSCCFDNVFVEFPKEITFVYPGHRLVFRPNFKVRQSRGT